MKPRILYALATIMSLALSSIASDSDKQTLEQRRKAFKNCECFTELAEKKSQLELTLPMGVKVTHTGDSQAVKPSDETIRLGMQMKTVCEAFLSDPKMTTKDFFDRLHELEDKQRQVEKFSEGLTETLHPSDQVTAVKGEKKK